ncbi:MAG: CD1247 N-terminal domain-containing protein [Bacillota bacterium]
MVDLQKKVAYLQGLMEGLDLEDSKEKRILKQVLDILEDVTDALQELKQGQTDLEDYIESVDEDLFDLEDEIYDDDDDDDDDDYRCDCDEDGEYVEVECPKCHDLVVFDASIMEDDDLIEVTCPNCDEVVFVNDAYSDQEGEESQEEEDKNTEDI